MLLALGAAHFDDPHLIKMPPVGKAGQWVGTGQALQPGIGGLQFGGTLIHQVGQPIPVLGQLVLIALLALQVVCQTALQLVDSRNQLGQFVLALAGALQTQVRAQVARSHAFQVRCDAPHMHRDHAIEHQHDESRQHQRLQQLRHDNGGQLAAQALPQHLLIAIQHQIADFLTAPGERRVDQSQAAHRRPAWPAPVGMRTLENFRELVGQSDRQDNFPHRGHALRTVHISLQGLAVQLPDGLGQGVAIDLFDLCEISIHAGKACIPG